MGFSTTERFLVSWFSRNPCPLIHAGFSSRAHYHSGERSYSEEMPATGQVRGVVLLSELDESMSCEFRRQSDDISDMERPVAPVRFGLRTAASMLTCQHLRGGAFEKVASHRLVPTSKFVALTQSPPSVSTLFEVGAQQHSRKTTVKLGHKD
ncbi:unnamed protein product [Pleuronectes platessa]|uniref:Uncharacterized protein n=1 Tax=Pleuronectes platessa TaxID=8262 RepID=A0A9N7VA92_PLEPL|nr:unnamed protein product [Pleuronectes platessa]